jgi:hypothetical protein
MSPVVDVTESIPSRKAKASSGFMSKTNGSISASVTRPPMPGRIPTAKPMRIPRRSKENVAGVKT